MISATIIPQDIKVDNETLEISPEGYLRVKQKSIAHNHLELNPYFVYEYGLSPPLASTSSTTLTTVKTYTLPSNYTQYSFLIVMVTINTLSSSTYSGIPIQFRIKSGDYTTNTIVTNFYSDRDTDVRWFLFPVSTLSETIEFQLATGNSSISARLLSVMLLLI